MGDQRRLPSYVYLPPSAAKRQAEATESGVFDLLPHEIVWRDRYNFLLKKGYRLRPRYRPGWKPSWAGTNIDLEFSEDSVLLYTPDVIDATRESDGSLVAIKTYLRPWNDPEFIMIGDVVEFVSQMLEGLAFLHDHRVAHRDIAPQNVMMDGRSLYPHGHHPVWRDRSPDAVEDLIPLARIDHPVKYFYVDFGLSVRFSPGQSTLVVGDVGRDASVPELSSTVPYDAYKADIYALGTFFEKELLQTYRGTEILKPIVDSMKQREPARRPTANDLIDAFAKTRKSMNPSDFRWRLAPRSEPAYECLFKDTVAVTRNSISQLRRFVVRPE
ncbi:hypothetical protein NUW54_g5122 [Trametes sanguinea]|uniref:Uncharacterized protein n=1 Tax=Trametes sanguinea TaxID=158606 RepID=A0ACC1PW05_9APHY|nr:hypothetical protein NUW54_g5122 [Trametes sanguinea]